MKQAWQASKIRPVSTASRLAQRRTSAFSDPPGSKQIPLPGQRLQSSTNGVDYVNENPGGWTTGSSGHQGLSSPRHSGWIPFLTLPWLLGSMVNPWHPWLAAASPSHSILVARWYPSHISSPYLLGTNITQIVTRALLTVV